MTRVFVQRGSASSCSSSSSSNNTNKSNSSPTLSQEAQEHVPCEDIPLEIIETSRNEDVDVPNSDKNEDEIATDTENDILTSFNGLKVIDDSKGYDHDLQADHGGSNPPPPPVPPPKPSSTNSNSRSRIGSSRRANVWPVVSTRTSPTGSHPSSPRSHCENEGYNSADEQSPCYGSSYDNAEREHVEIDIRRVKGFEVKKMAEDVCFVLLQIKCMVILKLMIWLGKCA